MKFLAISLLLIGLVGCQSSEVPPSPNSPGGVSGEYSVAVEELGSWANPAVTLYTDKDKLFFGASHNRLNIVVEDSFIWKEYYIYNYNNNAWQEFTFDNFETLGGGWIKTRASHLPLFGTKEFSGKNILATYSCSKLNSGFDCHGGWQVEGFTVEEEELPTNPTSPLTPENQNSTLKNYPESFEMGSVFRGDIILHDSSSSEITLAAIDIRTGLTNKGIKVNPISLESEEIHTFNRTDLRLYSNNILLVDNHARIAKELIIPRYCPEHEHYVSNLENEAYIILCKTGSSKQMIISGETNNDIRRAAKVLMNYEDYGLQGNVVRVTGTDLTNINMQLIE